MPYVDGDFDEKIWIDGFGDVAGDDGSFIDPALQTQTELKVDAETKLKEDLDKAIADANKQLDGDPVLQGGNAVGQSSGATTTAPIDPTLLSQAAKFLGLKEDQITRGMIGALLGAGLGKALSNQPQGIPARGIQSLAYTPNIATPTNAVGTRGRGSVSHFNTTGGSTQTPMGYSPRVYGPTGIEYLSSDTARAAGVNDYTLYRPTGVAPPPGTTGNPNLVNQAYMTLFGRSADPQGLAFFTQGLDKGQINPQNLLENIRRGAQGTDRDLLARTGYGSMPIGGWTYAAGGQTPTGLGYLKSSEDGMADQIPATIDGRQPAKLSGGEFVIPADVVSHLGNGNSDAGAKQLHDFMARIRKARTGNQEQGKRIDPAKFFPKSKG